MDTPERRPGWLTALFLLLVAAWLVIPIYLGQFGVILGATFFGEPPSSREVVVSERLLVGAAVAATAPPLIGLLFAVRWHRRVATWLFGLALVVGVVFAGFALAAMP